MKRVSSFTIYSVKCPACGTLNRFKGIQPEAYVETGRDTDFGPSVATSRDSEQKVKNPLLYFMGTCKKCFFTHELNREFIEWKDGLEFKSEAFKVSKTKHLQELRRKGSLIRKMGKTLKPSKAPFASSVMKLLMGIYDESLKPDSSYYNMGRYYLRVAWIFRDQNQKEKSAWINENLTIQSLDEAFGSTELQHSDYLQKVEKLKNLVESEFQLRHTATNQKIRKQCSSLINHMIKKLNSLKDTLDQLQQIYGARQDKESARDYASVLEFEDLLFDLKRDWPGVPVNEREALEFSLENYKKSLAKEVKGNRMIQIPYLIGELSRRTGDLASAEEYFDLTIDAGQDFVQQNPDDELKTALAKKILEMAHQQKEVILRGKE